MKSEQSIPELESSFHYQILLDNASPFPEEKVEEKTIYSVEEELGTFYLFEHSSTTYYWCVFFGSCICILVVVGIVSIFL